MSFSNRFPKNYFNKMLIILFLCFIVPNVIIADTTCVPIAGGVPYSPGPPNWFASPAPTTLHDGQGIYDRIDDPRWRGATSITDGGIGLGAGEDMEFRALYHSVGGDSSLYLSFWQKMFPGLFVDYEKVLYIGIRKPSPPGGGVLIKINILANNVTNSNSDLERTVERYNVNAQGVIESSILPGGGGDAWLNRIHVWADPISNMWAINVQVPIHESLLGDIFNIDDNFYMWYAIHNISTTGPSFNQYTWPRESEFEIRYDADNSQAIGDTLPAPDSWPLFHLSSGSSDPFCDIEGITISPTDIGTNHPSGENYIYTNTTETNTFFARPTNLTTQTYDSSKIHATFYLANWGLQPAYAVWDTIPGLEDVSQSPGGNVNPGGGQWNIQGTWTLSTQDSTDYSQHPHQCMFVQLYGKDLEFIKNSVYRNMDFVDLTFSGFSSKSAEVNVKGLPVEEGQEDGKRDVYIYANARNMSRYYDKEKALDKKFLKGAKNLSEIVNRIKERKKSITKRMYTLENVDLLCEVERPIVEQISNILPTYTVHGYYDTGRKIKTENGEKSILRPMTSFGYFVYHEGEVPGWEHSLRGEGLKKISDNLYKINVDGVASITTTIEVAKAPCPWWVWILIIILIIFLIVWIVRKMKK